MRHDGRGADLARTPTASTWRLSSVKATHCRQRAGPSGSDWHLLGCQLPLHLNDRDERNAERGDLDLPRDRAVDPENVVVLEAVDDVAGGLPARETDMIDAPLSDLRARYRQLTTPNGDTCDVLSDQTEPENEPPSPSPFD